MKIRVKINSNLRIANRFEPPVEMELDVGENSLQDLLKKLSDLYHPLKFIEEDGEMGEDLRYVYLNGESHFSFSQGLATKVNEGDTVLVTAYMEPLAGG
ncbi:MAG: hypothetical protein P4L43_13230 [Syntrophobacteraceae bacterium]|nr:hypothetical protein [Syntrophobacteraceae bacterium]